MWEKIYQLNYINPFLINIASSSQKPTSIIYSPVAYLLSLKENLFDN